jgi:enoyl-CoA hydratase/carnithine racemase
VAEALVLDLSEGSAGVRRALDAREQPLVLVAQSASGPIENGGELLRALLRHPMPVTGVLSGRVSGDGAALLLACDLLLVAPRSTLWLQPSGRGETVLLPMRIGQAGASRVWFRGGRLTASEAARSGWASIVRDGVESAVKQAAARYEGLSDAALGMLRPLLYRQAGLPVELAWALERAAFALAFDTGHPAEGVAAFLGKRKPHFPKANG